MDQRQDEDQIEQAGPLRGPRLFAFYRLMTTITSLYGYLLAIRTSLISDRLPLSLSDLLLHSLHHGSRLAGSVEPGESVLYSRFVLKLSHCVSLLDYYYSYYSDVPDEVGALLAWRFCSVESSTCCVIHSSLQDSVVLGVDGNAGSLVIVSSRWYFAVVERPSRASSINAMSLA